MAHPHKPAAKVDAALSQRLNHLLREAIASLQTALPFIVGESDRRLQPFVSEVNSPYPDAILVSRDAQRDYIARLASRLLRDGLADADLLNRIADRLQTVAASEACMMLGVLIPPEHRNPPDNQRWLAAIDAYGTERAFQESRDADAQTLIVAPAIAAYDAYYKNEVEDAAARQEAEVGGEPPVLSAFARQRRKRAGYDRQSWVDQGLVDISCTLASKRMLDTIVPLIRALKAEPSGAVPVLKALGFDRQD